MTLPLTDPVARKCPVCATERGEPHFDKEELHVVRCSRCGMIFANPITMQFVEGSFYVQQAAQYHLSPDKLQSDYAPVRFERELRMFRQFCRKGSVLDVGCSTGGFLHQLAQRFPGDYTTLGADVAGPALGEAERRGVPVLRAPFVEHHFGEQQFDAITFWAVLEHLAEPRKFLIKAATVLKPGGHCFVLVPNMKSLAVRWLGPRYRYIIEEHLNYFDSRTLRRFVATESAFAIVEMKSTHFNPVVLWLDRYGGTRRVPDDVRAALLKRTTAWKQNPLLTPMKWIYSGVERLLGRLRLADNLVIVLRRK
jgi:2-polyprenyl-3-methyl-5-hydroxy-6-metoxy-1,4-benzoquinol methylase